MAEVLVIGSGGREEAIKQAMYASDEVDRVVVSADVNAGIEQFTGSTEKPFVVIGPEAPLVKGVADDLRDEGYVVFGASKDAARYEASKSFAVEMMRQAGVPHPETVISTDELSDRAYNAAFDATSYVIKADGLAGGKGVVLPKDYEEASRTTNGMRSGSLFDGAGKDIINFQNRHSGPEVSAMVIVGDNDEHVILPIAQDHKRLGNGDIGPNTGGMGAYAPVPPSIMSAEQYRKVEDIAGLSLEGMRRSGTPYQRAVLYIGLMLSEQLQGDPVVIEYNVRFGDPETQVILPLAEQAGVDMYRLLRSAAEGSLEKPDIDFSKLTLSALTVCLAAKGYPGTPRKGDSIWGFDQHYPGVTVQRAAVSEGNKTNGGRVLYVTGTGETIDQAAARTYGAIDVESIGPESGKVGFADMQLRTDIGHQARS